MLDCGVEQLNALDAKRLHTTFYRHSMKLQKTLLTCNEVKLRNALFHKVCFDGNKIFEKERLAALSHFFTGSFFTALRTFKKEKSTTGENCFRALKELIDPDVLQHVICIMTDTTALNTGPVKGIRSRLFQHINSKYGHDVMVLECLYHSTELYLDNIITAFDGQTKAPDKLMKKSAFNHIAEIEKADISVSNLQQCNVKPSTLAQSVIKECFDILLLNLFSNNQNSMWDDQACHLGRVCFTFMDVPHAIHKYLFQKQETLHHARWMTKANGYLQILNFHLFELTMTNSQKAALNSICQFILDVYAPMFFSIYTRPNAVEGPALV